MNTTILTKEELQQLNAQLPRSSRAMIARKLGITYQTVKMVLNGTFDMRLDVIELAIAEIERKENLINKVREINKQYNEPT